MKAATADKMPGTESLADRVSAALQLIVEATPASRGARITERWVVDRFAVTHTQAREVLHRLDKLGALTLSSRRGATLALPQENDPTDVRPVWLALLRLAADRAGQATTSAPPVKVGGTGPWADYRRLRAAIDSIAAGAGVARLGEILQRLALASYVAHGAPGPIDSAALTRLATRLAARQLTDTQVAIDLTFLETTPRFPARREAAQLPQVAPTPVIAAGETAPRLARYLQRIGARALLSVPSALSATDQLASAILQRIQFGGLKPGDPVRELPLAMEFGVSRGPVRDALRLLDRRGLICIEGRRGAFVRRLDRQDIADLFAIRAALSSVQLASAASAPERPAWIDEELEAGADLLDALAHDPGCPYENYIVGRRALALVTLAAGGNIVVGRLAAEMEGAVSILWATVLDQERRVASAATWRAIVDAILARDADAAAREGYRIVSEAGVAALKAADAQG